MLLLILLKVENADENLNTTLNIGNNLGALLGELKNALINTGTVTIAIITVGTTIASSTIETGFLTIVTI